MRILLAVILGVITAGIASPLIFIIIHALAETIVPIFFPLADGIAIHDPQAENIAVARILIPSLTSLFVALLVSSFLGAMIARKFSKGAKLVPWIVIAWPVICAFIIFAKFSNDGNILGLTAVCACGIALPPLGAFLAQKHTRPYFFAPQPA